MIRLVDKVKSAACHEGYIVVAMESGVEIRFPISGNPRLATGTLEQLNRIELSPDGLHWPDLNEDLSLRGLMEGNYGQAGSCRTGEIHTGCPEQAFAQYLREMPNVGEDADFARITGTIREAHLTD